MERKRTRSSAPNFCLKQLDWIYPIKARIRDICPFWVFIPSHAPVKQYIALLSCQVSKIRALFQISDGLARSFLCSSKSFFLTSIVLFKSLSQWMELQRQGHQRALQPPRTASDKPRSTKGGGSNILKTYALDGCRRSNSFHRKTCSSCEQGCWESGCTRFMVISRRPQPLRTKKSSPPKGLW